MRRSFRILAIAFLLGLSVTCSTAPLKKDSSMPDRVVIFVPGLYGTALHEKTSGGLRWPSVAEIVFRRRELALSDDAMASENATERLVPGAVVDSVKVVPGIYSVDVYGKTLARLRRRLGESFHVRTFPYDWRRELGAQARQLDALVDAEIASGRSVALVAHSMGGLVVSYYLRYGAQAPEQARENWAGLHKIDRLVLAGVPYGGSIMAFVDLIEGQKIGPNPTLLNAAAYQSFPSIYQLLPETSVGILDENFVALQAPLLEQETWARHAWGAFGTSANSAPAARALAESRQLKRLLQQAIELAPPKKLKTLIVHGSGRKTLDKVVWLGANRPGNLVHDRKTWKQVFGAERDDSILYVDGDSVVSVAAARVPGALAAALDTSEVVTQRSHRRLLVDREVLERIGRFFEWP